MSKKTEKQEKESILEEKELDSNEVASAEPQQESNLESLLQEEKEKFLRLFAEFENYKKRTSKERLELFKTANQDVITAVLPVLDDFDRSITQLSKLQLDGIEGFLEGVTLIQKKFQGILKQKGLETIEIHSGDPFDAELHEAITQIPAPNEEMKNKVIDMVEKGYKLGDKIIRFPKVVVGT